MNISWLALDVNILDDTKIKLIRKYPDGDRLFILWIGLLCLAMRSENTGLVEISQGIPYSPEDLATLFDLEIKTVQFGLKLFSSERFRMILLTEGSTIEICNFMKYQRYDRVQRVREQTRERVARFREARKLLVSPNKIEGGNALLTQEKRSCNDTQYNNNTNTNTDTKQKEREREDARAKHRFGEFKNVTLMDHELEKLKIDYGDDQALKAIEFLSAYKASKHYPTKSDYLTIKRWVFDALKERGPGRQNRIDQIVQNWRAKHEHNELDKAFLPIAQLGISPNKPPGALDQDGKNAYSGTSCRTHRENTGYGRDRPDTTGCQSQREDIWAIHGSRHVHGFGPSQVMQSGPLDGGFPLRE
jgi:predicted phage replisome organizer